MFHGHSGGRSGIMRACHIVYGYFPFDPRVRREAEALQREGHEIDVIALREEGEPLEENVHGFRVHRIPLSIVRGGFARYAYQYIVFLLASAALLLRLHATRRYRVAHIHSLPDFQVFCAAPLRLLGARVVLDLHEAMPEIFAARFRLDLDSFAVRVARALELISCAFASAVVTQNEVMRDLVAERSVDRSKIVVIMNSPDPAKLVLSEPDRLRRELGLTGQRPVVYVGGINAERDLGLLVEAVARLREQYPIRLAIFGYGDEGYRRRLQEIADGLGLRENFLLGPRLPQELVFEYLSLSELGLITYEENPLTELTIPNKVFEYAAARKPLVIADLRTLRRLFNGAALFYQPGDAEDLAKQMQRLLDDAQLRSDLVARAERILESCNWGIMTGRLHDLYDRLSGNG